MAENATRVGTITDAAERYSCDGAAVWGAIAAGYPLRNPDGELVRLVADPEKRDGDTWIVEELPVGPGGSG